MFLDLAFQSANSGGGAAMQGMAPLWLRDALSTNFEATIDREREREVMPNKATCIENRL
jgi:hypothetical protein